MAEQNNQKKNGGQQDANQLVQVRYDKLHELQANGKNPFEITKYDVTHHSTEIKDNFETLDGQEVSVAGRMMFKRVMGKASFCNVQDLKGRIQIYVARDEIGEDSYKDFKKYDVGDILGIKGKVFKTQTGEISVHAQSVTLLSKSLQILPEKFHGLTDTDTRYRQRYVDLIMNDEVKDTFVKRSKVISSIRRYLDGQGFMEVETPMLVSNAGGAAARPFETHFNALNEDLKLRISLELYLKRLIVGGMERVYEIGRVFRNEGLDTRHNPEFTLMELYQAYTDYHGMMDLTENLYRYIAKEVTGSEILTYGENQMDLSKPFERITMVDAVKKYANVDFNEVPDTAAAKKLADEHHIEYEERHEKGDILNLFFEEYVEEHLIQPTFVMDHPIEISPLTKMKPEDPNYVERFEFFMNGWEMANAYSELNDPIDQRERFKAQEELLAQGDDEANTTDEDFLNALEIGMPPTGGIGFGIECRTRTKYETKLVCNNIYYDKDGNAHTWFPPEVDGGGGVGGGYQPVAPKAKAIFRNSNMTDNSWKTIENLLNKMTKTKIGEALYHKLQEALKGKTLIIQFISDNMNSNFDPGLGGIKMRMDITSSALLHALWGTCSKGLMS